MGGGLTGRRNVHIHALYYWGAVMTSLRRLEAAMDHFPACLPTYGHLHTSPSVQIGRFRNGRVEFW